MLFYIIGGSVLVLTVVVYREEIWRNVFSQNQRSEPEHQEEEKVVGETLKKMRKHIPNFPYIADGSYSEKYWAQRVDQINSVLDKVEGIEDQSKNSSESKESSIEKPRVRVEYLRGSHQERDVEEEQKEEETIIAKYKSGAAEFIKPFLVGIELSQPNLGCPEKVNEIICNHEKRILFLSNLKWIDHIDFMVMMKLLTDARTSKLIEDPVKLENGEFCSLKSVREGEQYETDDALTALLVLIISFNLKEVCEKSINAGYFLSEPKKAHLLFRGTIGNNIYREEYFFSKIKNESDVLEEKESHQTDVSTRNGLLLSAYCRSGDQNHSFIQGAQEEKISSMGLRK